MKMEAERGRYNVQGDVRLSNVYCKQTFCAIIVCTVLVRYSVTFPCTVICGRAI